MVIHLQHRISPVVFFGCSHGSRRQFAFTPCFAFAFMNDFPNLWMAYDRCWRECTIAKHIFYSFTIMSYKTSKNVLPFFWRAVPLARSSTDGTCFFKSSEDTMACLLRLQNFGRPHCPEEKLNSKQANYSCTKRRFMNLKLDCIHSSRAAPGSSGLDDV